MTTPNNTLKFGTQYSVNEFKANHSGDSIKLVKNPHTNKVFFTCGSTSGKVSLVWNNAKKTVISEVNDGTESFLMLHNASDTNVIAEL